MQWKTVAGGVVLSLSLLGPGAVAGESGWREVAAPHVVLRTNLDSREAREAALTVERYRAQLIAAAWPRANLPIGDAIEMTVFASRGDFEHYFTRRITGIFFHDLPPVAVMWGSAENWETRRFIASPETNSVLRHELTHHLANSIFRRQPRWFSEGLAQFLETVRPSDDGKSVIVGAANYEALAKYARRRGLRVANVLAWKGKVDAWDPLTSNGLYGVSWALVHWLYNVHSDQFGQLQALLAKGVDSEKAWKVILPALGTTNIDDTLADYIHGGRYQEFQLPLPPLPPMSIGERPLSEADVHATRGNMAIRAAYSLQSGAEIRKEAEQELATALRLDPKNLLAELTQMRMVPPAERLGLARALVADHPEEGRAWLMLAGTLGPGSHDEQMNAVSKAVELLPDNALALSTKAAFLLEERKAAEAAPFAVRAATVAPYSPPVLVTLAGVQAALGRCTEAVASQARAMELLSEQASAQARQLFEAKLAEYQNHCVTPESSPAVSNAPAGSAATGPTAPAGAASPPGAPASSGAASSAPPTPPSGK